MTHLRPHRDAECTRLRTACDAEAKRGIGVGGLERLNFHSVHWLLCCEGSGKPRGERNTERGRAVGSLRGVYGW